LRRSDSATAITEEGMAVHSSSSTPWVKNALIWAAIGAGFLFFGGLAAHGYRRMLDASSASATPIGPLDWVGLAQLSLGGGIVVGLIGLALTLASPRGIGWTMGLGTVGLLLFLLFIWPTPYKFYRTKGGQLIRVHRLTGSGQEVLPPSPPAATGEAPSRGTERQPG
jgi:hypothetical protein